MDVEDYVSNKGGVSCESLVLFLVELINVSRPHGHVPYEGTLISQLLPIHPHEVPCDVSELLCSGDYVKPLV